MKSSLEWYQRSVHQRCPFRRLSRFLERDRELKNIFRNFQFGPEILPLKFSLKFEKRQYTVLTVYPAYSLDVCLYYLAYLDLVGRVDPFLCWLFHRYSGYSKQGNTKLSKIG